MNVCMVGSALIVASDFLMWRTGVPRRGWLRTVFHWGFFGGLSTLLLHIGLIPWAPELANQHNASSLIDLCLLAAWWLMAGRCASSVGRWLLVRPSWPKERLIQEVIGAALIIASGVVALTLVFRVPLRGLIATSGAAAIVIGLAVQNILHDVFAGIVISATEPYHPGDLIVIDDMQGRVIETNWHATHVLSTDLNLVVIPNSVAARSKIINKSRPTTQYEITIQLSVPSSYAAHDVAHALKAGALQLSSFCDAPSPYVTVKSSRFAWVVYEVVGYIDDVAQKHDTIVRLHDACHRQLAASGIHLTRAIARRGEQDIRRSTLSRSIYFADLDDARLERILSRVTLREYREGDTLLDAYTISDELFVVVSGVCAMKIPQSPASAHVARLGPSETFGEAGVFAGLPGRFDMEALTCVSALAIEQSCIADLLATDSRIAHGMCRTLARRDDILQAAGVPSHPSQPPDESVLAWLLDRFGRIAANLS